MNKRFARISALALLALLFAGCATTSVTQSASSPAQSAALLLLERGQPREAALQLEAQAAAAAGSERNQLLADAAFAWYESGDAARARSLAAQVQPRQLSGLSKVR
ncbi:hypothetical protein A989_02245, partial [Xanthomonas translucens DAR61454]